MSVLMSHMSNYTGILPYSATQQEIEYGVVSAVYTQQTCMLSNGIEAI